MSLFKGALSGLKLFLFKGALSGLTQFLFKGALSGLKRFLATESLLKVMKNAFYFTSKALSVLKIFKLLS